MFESQHWLFFFGNIAKRVLPICVTNELLPLPFMPLINILLAGAGMPLQCSVLQRRHIDELWV